MSWEPERQTRFACLGCQDGGLRQCGDVTECEPELVTAGEIFLSRAACLRVLAGQNAVSLCLVRTNSVCQSSAPVTAFWHHAGDAGPGYFE